MELFRCKYAPRAMDATLNLEVRTSRKVRSAIDELICALILANWRFLLQCLDDSLNRDMAGTQLRVFVVTASATRASARNRLLCSPRGTSTGIVPRPKTRVGVLASHSTVTRFPDRSSLRTVRVRITNWPAWSSGFTTGQSPFLLLAALRRSNSRSATATGA